MLSAARNRSNQTDASVIYQCQGVYYTEFLHSLCLQRGIRKYIEIGVNAGDTFSKIDVEYAIGVDPGFRLASDPTLNKKVAHLFKITSDSFFRDHVSSLELGSGIDLAFIDGMHLFEYALRDFYNCEAISQAGGVITLHDCLPFDGEMIERVNNTPGRTPGSNAEAWTGDVWKIIPILKEYRPDLRVTLVDCAPTGLVCISQLDPNSTILKDKYMDIVDKYRSAPNDASAISKFYENAEIVSAVDILKDYNQSLYFNI
jgi:hypothetical protein